MPSAFATTVGTVAGRAIDSDTPAHVARSGIFPQTVPRLQGRGLVALRDSNAWRIAPREVLQKPIPQLQPMPAVRQQIKQHVISSPCRSSQTPPSQPETIPQAASAGAQEQVEQNEITQEPVPWSHACSPETDVISGPFRLKDGLFFSSPCVAADRGFLAANKVSHVVAIEEGPQRHFEQPQLHPSAANTSLWRPLRNLDIHWRLTEEHQDPVCLPHACACVAA